MNMMSKSVYEKAAHRRQKATSKFDEQDLIKYGYPVNFEKCQHHRKANLICKSVLDGYRFSDTAKYICECCGRVVGNQPVKTIFYDINIFAKYGSGIPLYFLFFKYVIYLLLIYFLIFGVYGVVSNFMAHDCQKFKHCWSDTIGMKLSFLNSYEEGKITLIQLILTIILIVIQIFTFLFIRHTMRFKKWCFDQYLTSPSDFSVILRRLPKNTTQDDIVNTIVQFSQFLTDEQKIQTNNMKVYKVLFAHDLKQYLQVQEENMSNFKKSCFENTEFYKIPSPKIKQKLPTAIVIFQKQRSKGLLIGHLSCMQQIYRTYWLGHQPLSDLITVKHEYVNVERAPEPDDIIWENQGVDIFQLYMRKLAVNTLSFGLLLASTYAQYELAQWRMTFEVKDQRTQRLFSLLLAGFITIMNYIIKQLLVLSSHFQKPTSQTILKTSMIYKLVLMQFINSGLISIFISAVIYLPKFRFHKTLICNDMLFIMILNVFVNNTLNFVMVIFQIPSLVERFWLYLHPERYTQLEANKVFEAPEVDIQYKYAYIFKTIWLTAFFMPTQPCVIFLSILALTINYWSQKYLFSGCYTIPRMFSGRISTAVLDLLNYTCLWMILGSLFIHLLRVNFILRLMPLNYLVTHIVGLILSLFIIYAPLSALSGKIFGQINTKNSYHKSYQLEEENFQMTYQNTNPAYKKDRIFKGKFDYIGQQLAQIFINNPNSVLF